MIDRRTPGRVNVITHLHTTASTALASEMDSITAAIHAVAGPDTKIAWTECFTPVETIVRLLRRGRSLRGPVHLAFVTDHMRARAHAFPAGHLAAAAAEPRLALGAEIRTRARDADGAYRQGPEILVWGSGQPVDGPYGPYYGVSQALLDELYDTCRDPDGRELCTRRARALLLERGVAHGLSHPFDGHALSLEGTFAIISEFTYIEALNGGYFDASTRVLDAYLALHNALVAGAHLSDDLLTPVGRRLVRHIRGRGRRLCRLGGSDAHSHDFDRVVSSFALPPGHAPRTVRPGDFCAALLGEEEGAPGTPRSRLAPEDHVLTAAPRLCQLGTPASPARQLTDILAIIARNFWHDAPHFGPVTFVKTVDTCTRTTMNELRIRRSQQAIRTRALADDFDPAALLPFLRYPDGLTAARPRSAAGVPVGPS